MTIVPFESWTKRGVWGSPSSFTAPAAAVVIHHSVTNVTSRSSIEQAQDIEEVIWGRRTTSKFSMVAYNFIVSRAGAAFEGRGFTWRNGANNRTKSGAPPWTNSNTVSICFAGNYEPNVSSPVPLVPSSAQMAAAGEVIREGIAAGQIVANPPVIAHSVLHATACCGDSLRARLHEINTEGHPMPLHHDAQAAKDLGIWNGSNPDQSATREQAAIMSFRAYNLAVQYADREIAAAIAGIVDTSSVTVRPGESVTVTGVN